MTVYFVSLIVSIALASLSSRARSKRCKVVLIACSALPFILVASFRDFDVGVDTWKNYGPTFEKAALFENMSDALAFLSSKYEHGFSALVFLLSRITGNPTILFFFCAVVTIGFTYAAIYRQSNNISISVVIFFFSGAFLLSMNGMRGYMAISIVLFALNFIREKRPIPYMVFIVLASSIHASVLVFLLVYPLYYLKLSGGVIFVITCGGILVVPFSDAITKFFLGFTAYSNYLVDTASHVDPLYTMLAINSLILLVYFSQYRRLKDDIEYMFYLKMQAISVIVCAFSFVIPFAFRAEQIVDYVQIIALPYFLHALKVSLKCSRRVVLAVSFCIVVVFVGYFLKAFVFDDSNQVSCYSSVLSI